LHINAQTERWEYRVLYYTNTTSGEDLTDKMNRYGIEGWELVTSTYSEKYGSGYLYFKRRLP
jgi:hypothetical protein